MAIYLIRHGETAFNKARVVQHPEVPLSERGVAQARRLAERLADAGITRILCSDMARARMTAEPLEQVTGLRAELDPDLRERFFGDHCGTPYSELMERGLDIFAPDHEPPNGESWPVFHDRVERGWATVGRLAAEGKGHLAVVTHGLVCHSITARLVERPAVLAPGSYGLDGPPIRFGNTAISILEGPSPWRFDLFACTAHLDGAVADDGSALSGL